MDEEESFLLGGQHHGNFSDVSEQYTECLLESLRADLPPDHCPPSFDRVLCWPAQPAGSLAELPCMEELNGVPYDTSKNATRWCLANATWSSYSNYSLCVDLQGVSSPIEPNVEITAIIYLIGYSVSLVGLIIAVSIFWYFRELNCLRNRLHLNLMLSVIGANLVWIFNLTVAPLWMGQAGSISCAILVVLLHYTMLTNFFWMFVEGLYIFTLVGLTFQQGTATLPVYLAIGWGSPLVIVLAWIIARLTHPVDQDSYQWDVLGKHCPWMVSHWSDWINQSACIVVLAFNCFFLFLIMYVLIRKLRSDNMERQQISKAARALLVLIPLLGISYILLLTGPSQGVWSLVFTHTRAFLLSIQGLAVSICYCFLNSEVRNTLRNHLAVWRQMRSIGRQRNGRSLSVPWTHRDTETGCLEASAVGRAALDEGSAVKNGHDVNDNNNTIVSVHGKWTSRLWARLRGRGRGTQPAERAPSASTAPALVPDLALSPPTPVASGTPTRLADPALVMEVTSPSPSETVENYM